jgi:hypothetical protein
MWIGHYLWNTCKRGIIYKVDKSKGIQVNVDADFAGGWSSADADNADNFLSRTGFVICYVNCLLVWCSKLQTEIVLSTAEVTNIGRSHALWDTYQSRTLSKRLAVFFFCQILFQIFALQLIRITVLLSLWQNHWNLHPAQTYCYQISSLLQQGSNIIQQIRWHQAQVHFNKTTMSNMISSSNLDICCEDGDSY